VIKPLPVMCVAPLCHKNMLVRWLTFAFVCVQILYPTYEVDADRAVAAMISAESGTPAPPPATSTTTSTGPTPAAVPTNGSTPGAGQVSEVKGAAAADKLPPPPDEEIIRVLRQVRLGHLLSRYATGEGVCGGGGGVCVSCLCEGLRSVLCLLSSCRSSTCQSQYDACRAGMDICLTSMQVLRGV
jgi:hypothetical protein